MLSLACGFSVEFTGISCSFPSTTFTFAGTSTKVSSPSFASTITSFSPGVVVSTGALYLNVIPSGYCSGSILLEASGCLLFLSTATYCVLGSTTTILAGIFVITLSPILATTTTSFSPGVNMSTGVS